MSRKDRVVWLEQGWQPVAIGFCPSERAWTHAMKGLNGAQPWPESANMGGHTLLGMNDKTGCHSILVAIGRSSERSALDVILTIVHEAVHVWQFVRQVIGEDRPGIEMEAYGIEGITRGLIDAYCDTQGKGKKWLTD